MAARKTAKKAQSKKASTKKSVKPVRPVASSNKAELEELRAMKNDIAKGFAELKKEREDFKREQDLARINREMAAGNMPQVVGAPSPTPAETPEQRIARQREEARAERRRKREEERKRAAQPATPVPMPAPVTDLNEARAKKSKDKGVIKLQMDELCRYKLEVLNRNYADELNKIRDAVRPKFLQAMEQEVRQMASKEPACVKAQREQIEYINEVVERVDPQLPEGYAITQLLTEVSLIVAQYVPERAGKPLPLPGLAPPEEG